MLLKYSQLPKRSKLATSGKPQRSTGNAKSVNGKGKCHRKGIKGVASKRIRAVARREEVYALPVDPCDNSNDSGLGFDHHLDFQVPRTTQTSFTEQEYYWPEVEAKRQRVDIKLESDNANDDFTFPQTPRAVPATYSPPAVSSARSGKAVPSGKGLKRGSQAGLTSNAGFSRDGKVQLVILSQPEMQHRARYQTEGSRGAVKDRTGNGFPVVKLNGYNKPAILEVYIGTDQGREAPHMFYQACRVSGKNSTPCVEKSVNGTVLIEIEFDPSKDMTVMCDCVGILKERNVDVEHRFPEESTSRNKKKSTRCRMVFRTVITNSDNTLETLQVTSQPIICTQPPGVPEICKKSMVSCHSAGGLELFILGKNFLKDTRVLFSDGEANSEGYWEAAVQPDKEFLQQSHLVCTIPPYKVEDIKEPVVVKLSVVSSGRSSEAHTFVYTPLGTPPFQALPREPMVAARGALAQCVSQPAVPFQSRNLLLGIPLIQLGSQTALTPPAFIQPETHKREEEPLLLMPPPPPALLPAVRRSSQTMGTMLEDHIELKREVTSPPSQNITPELSMSSQSPSMATIRQFVSSTPLPSLSVENYLSNIESTSTTSATQVPITSQKFEDHSSLSSNDQISMLKNTIVVSMANDAQVASKLDAFVKSNAESQMSPGGEVQAELPGRSEGEMVLGSIGIPQQTSPLNLNTHEGIVAALSPPHLISMERDMAPSQSANLCEMLNDASSQSQTLPLPSQIIDTTIGSSSNLILDSSFSNGDKMIVSVPENLNMNVGQLTDSSAFTELPGSSTATTTANSLLMKVVDGLSQPSQFSSSVIHSSMETTSQSSPIQTSLVPPGFMTHEQVPELMNMPTTYLSSRPLPVEQREVQNLTGLTTSSHFAPPLINSMVTEQSQHLASPETASSDQTSSNSNLICKEEPFSGSQVLEIDNHFAPPVMTITTVDNVKTISPVESTFQSEMVFSNAQKMPIVSSELSLGPSTFSDVSSGSELKDGFTPSTFAQASLNQAEPTVQTSIMTGNPVMNATQHSDVTMKSTSGNSAPIATQPFHSNCSIVGSFSSQTASQDGVGFVKVSTTASTTASTLEKDGGNGTKTTTAAGPQVKKVEDGIPLPHELTNMSEHDLLSYINPSCFDTM